jgi:hypothetical protein
LFRFDRCSPFQAITNALVLSVRCTAETLIDKTIELQSIGGVYGNQKPTEFICLLLKLLQIQPEKEILVEYLRADEFKLGYRFWDLYKRTDKKAQVPQSPGRNVYTHDIPCR